MIIRYWLLQRVSEEKTWKLPIVALKFMNGCDLTFDQLPLIFCHMLKVFPFNSISMSFKTFANVCGCSSFHVTLPFSHQILFSLCMPLCFVFTLKLKRQRKLRLPVVIPSDVHAGLLTRDWSECEKAVKIISLYQSLVHPISFSSSSFSTTLFQQRGQSILFPSLALSCFNPPSLYSQATHIYIFIIRAKS